MSFSTSVRLVHTSDIHLGVDWRDGLSERAFSRVIDSVDRLDADALLVVGDVFDHARVPDRALEFYLDQIGRLDCPVVTLPGNHDLYHQDTLYRRAPFAAAPPNFHLITGWDGHTITLPDLAVDVWGRAMDQHTPDFKPLAGMPTRQRRPLAGCAWPTAIFTFPKTGTCVPRPYFPPKWPARPATTWPWATGSGTLTCPREVRSPIIPGRPWALPRTTATYL